MCREANMLKVIQEGKIALTTVSKPIEILRPLHQQCKLLAHVAVKATFYFAAISGSRKNDQERI